MQSPPSNYPSQPRSPWFYVLWGCGGCACLAVIVAVGGIFLLGWGVKKGFEGMSNLAREAQVDLKMQSHKMVSAKGERYIAGTLKNISPTHTYSVAIVEFYLFDKSGQALPSASAQTQSLKPGATWTFKAPVTEPTAVTYKFREVSGFQDITEDPNIDPATRQRLKAQRAEMDRRLQEIIQKAKDDAAKQNNH
ncbi:MAG: hypothetical protein JWL77_4013 [Chthonomonadaceae bacterium]|nr:hypothetical protein [Chthonomonadaceae bacterium]